MASAYSVSPASALTSGRLRSMTPVSTCITAGSTTKTLALAWQHAEPEDFAGVMQYVQTHAYLSTSLFDEHASWRGSI